jgi:hypothetical protein
MRACTGRRLAGFGASALCIVAASLVPALPVHAATTKVTVVADHLDNPRGVSIGTGGRVLVAEAGNGDANGGRCAGVIDPESGIKTTECLGFTGAVIAVQGTKVTQVLTKLPSAAAPSGFEASGPAFAMDASGGKVAVIMQGVTNQPPASWKPWATTTFDHVLFNSTPQPSLDLGAYEKAHDPAHDGVASDPYSEALGPTGAIAVVVDAGANDALLVKNGTLSTLAAFPPQKVAMPGGGTTMQQSVPTSVVAMPDGSYLIGELTGYPYAAGSARIWRVVPGHAPTVWKTGFTNIVGLARGSDGSIYVSELTSHGLLQASSNASGALLRIAPNGTKTQIAVAGLKYAGGVAVAADGSVYIANCSVGLPNSTSPCRGQLLKVSVS